MSLSAKTSNVEYPFSKVGVYISAIVAMMSIILALLVLTDPVWLTYYFVFASFLTLAIAALKIRFFSKKKSRPFQNSSLDKARSDQKWKVLLIIGFFILTLFAPVFLLVFLSIEIWFICLDGVVLGVSLSEVVFFYYTRKNLRAKNDS